MSVGQWQKNKPNIHKRPAIFLVYGGTWLLLTKKLDNNFNYFIHLCTIFVSTTSWAIFWHIQSNFHFTPRSRPACIRYALISFTI
jgi:hypothetical protein